MHSVAIAMRHITIQDVFLNAGHAGLRAQLFGLLPQQAIVVHFQRCREKTLLAHDMATRRWKELGLLTCGEWIP